MNREKFRYRPPLLTWPDRTFAPIFGSDFHYFIATTDAKYRIVAAERVDGMPLTSYRIGYRRSKTRYLYYACRQNDQKQYELLSVHRSDLGAIRACEHDAREACNALANR